MQVPAYEELSEDLKRALDPQKPKALAMIAKGVAPLPAPVLFSAWCFLLKHSDETLKQAAEISLTSYPEKMLLNLAQAELPAWALFEMGIRFHDKESVVEAVLLNEFSPDSLFLEVAKTCSEKMANMIANNQERIIQSPEIILSLEQNPQNLKSNTDRLRHFLQLAGISIPGDAMKVIEDTPEEKAAATPAATSDADLAEMP